jgi:triosephosphate isomerase
VAFPTDVQLSILRNSALNKDIQLGAQSVSATNFGAFTGEATAEQFLDVGASWALIGHSERRSQFGESEEVCLKKLKRTLETNLKVVYCIGESLQERESGVTNTVLAKQLEHFKNAVTKWDNLVIAYEPVWAIGTGKVASPQQAEDAHRFIRQFLSSEAGKEVANNVRIIYGGSVTGSNAKDIVGMENIDGFLVGGASLKEDFVKIADSLSQKFKC